MADGPVWLKGCARALLLAGLVAGLVQVGSIDAPGTGVLDEGGAEFASGEHLNTLVSNGTVELLPGGPATTNWTFMGKGPFNPRRSVGFAYDSSAGVFVLFGGAYDIGETRVYDLGANCWTQKFPENSPAGRYSHAMVYDSANAVMVLFGGRSHADGPGDEIWYSDTWTYSVRNNTWTDVTPAVSPSARIYCGMAYDSLNKVSVMFGGIARWGAPQEYLADTWTFDAATSTWTNRTPAVHPPGRWGQGMAFDSRHGETVLFSGGGPNKWWNDTWTYNAGTNTWTDRHPSNPPVGRDSLGFDFDESAGVAVMFGGNNAEYGYQNETWTYDLGANAWTRQSPQPWMVRRYLHGMAYDSKANASVLFGGDVMTSEPYADHGRDVWAFRIGGGASSGIYVSGPHDLGGTAFFGGLRWEASVPPKTSIRFQLRTGSSRSELELGTFGGPDGRPDTWYDRSGIAINAIHNSSRWVQYKASLESWGAGATPGLKSVRIEYNLLHGVSVVSPAGSENWTGSHTIAWNAGDSDGDRLSFDIQLVARDGNTTLASGLADTARSWEWDTSGVADGTYRIKLIARDDSASIPLSPEAVSPEFTINHTAPWSENRQPVILAVSAPGGTGVKASDTVELSIVASDPDGDRLSYEWRDNGRTISTKSAFSQRFAPGNHTLVLTVSDGKRETTRDFNFTVAAEPVVREEGPAWRYGAGGAVALVAVVGLAAGLSLAAGTERGMYGLTVLLLPLYTRLNREEVLDNETRGMIRGCVYADPGIHYHEILRRLKLSNGNAAHHLMTLEREGFIRSRNDGRLKRFYPIEMRIDSAPVRLSRLEGFIYNAIREQEGMSQSEIARVLELSNSIVHRQVKRLAGAGVIRLERHGLSVRCYIADGQAGRSERKAGGG